MKIIYIGETPSFENGLPPGMMSIGFNAENKPVFEIPDGSLPDGAREAVDADFVGLPNPAKAFAKQITRSSIYRDVADAESLLGVTADAAHVLVLFACADAVALAQAKDFAAYKKLRMESLAALSGGEEGAASMAAQAGKLLEDVQSGVVVMPFLAKPGKASGVFADVARCATGVAQVLTQAQPATA